MRQPRCGITKRGNSSVARSQQQLPPCALLQAQGPPGWRQQCGGSQSHQPKLGSTPLRPTCSPRSARLAAESWPPAPRRMSGSLSAAAAAAMDCRVARQGLGLESQASVCRLLLLPLQAARMHAKRAVEYTCNCCLRSHCCCKHLMRTANGQRAHLQLLLLALPLLLKRPARRLLLLCRLALLPRLGLQAVGKWVGQWVASGLMRLASRLLYSCASAGWSRAQPSPHVHVNNPTAHSLHWPGSSSSSRPASSSNHQPPLNKHTQAHCMRAIGLADCRSVSRSAPRRPRASMSASPSPARHQQQRISARHQHPRLDKLQRTSAASRRIASSSSSLRRRSASSAARLASSACTEEEGVTRHSC